MAMRPLDGTSLEGEFGRTSSSCLPHGIIGQGYDGDSLGISGKVDNYTAVNNLPVITTSAHTRGGGDRYACPSSHSPERFLLTEQCSTSHLEYYQCGQEPPCNHIEDRQH